MSNLPDEYKKKPLNQLTLPGTHDSAAQQELCLIRYQSGLQVQLKHYYKLLP